MGMSDTVTCFGLQGRRMGFGGRFGPCALGYGLWAVGMGCGYGLWAMGYGLWDLADLDCFSVFP